MRDDKHLGDFFLVVSSSPLSVMESNNLAVSMFKSVFDLQEDELSDHSELAHLASIFDVNAHEVPVMSVSTFGLYDNASMIEHSCVNNASKHFTTSGEITIRAAVPIKKGDNIAINYSDAMWGTASRAAHLRQTKGFACDCPRCLDPTELGTYFSAVSCKKCSGSKEHSSSNGGFLLPTDPQNEKSSWVCDACGSAESHEYVGAVVKSIGEELLRLERSDTHACKKFLKKHLQNLHSNHFFLMDVRLAMIQMIGKNDDNNKELHEDKESEKELALKQRLSVELQEVVNVISPGDSTCY